MEKILNYIAGNKENFVEQLKEFLKIPSISTNPENVKDMKTAAEFVEKEMKSAGLENVKIMETPGHPVVYGEWLHAGEDKPTILIYGHQMTFNR
ncbi:MAG: hypothetical protein R2942_12885 [Ignavibacteria bacterium]